MSDNPKKPDGEAATGNGNQNLDDETLRYVELGRAAYQEGFVENPEQYKRMLTGLRQKVNQYGEEINRYRAGSVYSEGSQEPDDDDKKGESHSQDYRARDLFNVVWGRFESNPDFQRHADEIRGMLDSKRYQTMVRRDGLYSTLESALNECLAREYREERDRRRQEEELESRRREQARLNPNQGSTVRDQPSPDTWFQKQMAKLEAEINDVGSAQFKKNHDGKSFAKMTNELNAEYQKKLREQV